MKIVSTILDDGEITLVICNVGTAILPISSPASYRTNTIGTRQVAQH